MKLTRSFTSFALIFSLSLISFLTLPIQTTNAQDAKIALQRGYRTGYSDGYMAGYRDVIDNTAKSPARHSEYTKADRAYSKDYGLLEDYRDGYQQGFEIGYNTGFEKRSFDATLPTELKKRGIINPDSNAVVTTPTTTTPTTTQNTETIETKPTENTVSENTPSSTNEQTPTIQTKTNEVSYVPTSDAVIVVPTDTELILELIDEISTERNKEGDKFTARIVSPMELNGAIVEGKISKIQKPGRIKRRSEMLLSFDRIVLTEGRWSNFSAILTEVLPVKNDNVKRVDTEGTVEGKSSVKGDITKVSASTGTGALIGVIAGGPVGAAVGAGVGAAFGVGAVVVERGKHIRLNKAQQLRIKSTYETQIR
ncbi:MAG TPA: hypothetical protein VNB22_17760 [Pyrinomonadaceae bacterium]|jgi:hypothetical protein|nr:hypothetical protein [Pyrinomonadaceae bacterium]